VSVQKDSDSESFNRAISLSSESILYEKSTYRDWKIEEYVIEATLNPRALYYDLQLRFNDDYSAKKLKLRRVLQILCGDLAVSETDSR